MITIGVLREFFALEGESEQALGHVAKYS